MATTDHPDVSLNLDVARAVGAVTREVKQQTYEGKPARVVVATRSYKTTVDDLWEAITSAERIPRWFMPISGDLRLGGRYQLKGNAGGEILACAPPEHLKITWEYGGQTSWVDVRVEPDGSGARLTLEHIAHVSDADMWAEYGPGAAGVGWDMGLLGLGLHVEEGKTMDPAVAMAWPVSDEGKRFTRGASDGWRDASIADGTDPAQARAAADRTTAAYTGEGGGA